MADMHETDLYPPVKEFLEGQGYEVKGDVRELKPRRFEEVGRTEIM